MSVLVNGANGGVPTLVGTEQARFIDLAALGSPEVGHRIRAYRALKDLSQKELADLAQVTQTDISRLERTPQQCRLKVFTAVCAALGISLAALFEAVPQRASGAPVEDHDTSDGADGD